MRQQRKILVLTLLLILLFSGGCAWLNRQLSSALPPTLEIGTIVSSNVEGEKAAQAFEQGLKLAAKEINKKKETSQPEIKLIALRVKKKTPAEVVKAALEIEKRKVDAVFCYLSPTEAKIFFPLAGRLKRPVFIQSELSSPYPSYVYSLSPSEEKKGASLALLALDMLNKKKVAVFYSRGDRLQREKAYSFEKTFRERQGEVVLIRPYPLASPKKVYDELKRTEPEAIFLALNPNDEKSLLKEFSKNLKLKFVLLFGNDLNKKQAKLAGGGYFVRFQPLSIANLSDFSQKYADEFKERPFPASFSAYLGLYLFNNAVNKAKTTDSNLLVDALAKAKVEKAGSQYWLGKEKVLQGPAYFYQLRRDGQIVLIKAQAQSF